MMASSKNKNRMAFVKQDHFVPSADDDVFIGRLIRLVRRNPNHMVLMSELPEEYLYKYGQRFDQAFDLLGCCRDLTLAHPLRVSTIDWRDKDLYLMFEEKYYYNVWLKQMLTARRFALVEEAIGQQMPEDAVTLKNIDGIKQKLPPHLIEEVKPNQEMRVVLVNVESPEKIYGHLWKYRQAFLMLRQEMRQYNREDREEDENGYETDIVIPWEFLFLLLPVAVRNPQDNFQWNRCLVYNYQLPMTKDMITVFSLDFGNFFKVDRRECRYLKTKFLTQLPAQAFRMSLHGIEPLYDDKKWPKTAAEMLTRQFVWNRSWIYCNVVSVDDFSCRVRLCFSTSWRRIHLDHLLALHGLAMYDGEHIPIKGCDDDGWEQSEDGNEDAEEIECKCLK